MKKIISFALLLIFVCPYFVSAQSETGDTISAIKKKFKVRKNIKSAGKMMKKGNIYAASDLYETILMNEPENVGTAYQLAESYYLARDYKKAEYWYEKVTELDPVTYPQAYYYYALMMKMNARYASAKTAFEYFIKSYTGEDADLKKWAKSEADGCALALEMIKDPLPVNLYHLDDKVNSAYSDISPLVWNDTTLLFAALPSDTVIVLDKTNEVDHYIKMYSAIKRGNSYDTARVFDKFNVPGFHVANGTYSPDKNRFYFTKCEDQKKGGKILCFIYVSEYKNGIWIEPVMLSENINMPDFTNTQPTLAPYKKNSDLLYFVSDRPEGKGGLDIWYSVTTKKGYSEPKNLGAKINTEKNEATPFYDATTGTLYFSSNGLVNIGGYDIFKSEGSSTKWEEPVNIGYPINSSTDDMYFKPNENKGSGYFVSNRPGIISIRSETCCDDIFTYEFVKLVKVAVMGLVYDEDDSTKTPVNNSRVVLSLRGSEGIESDVEIGSDSIKNNEQYLFELNLDEDYKVTGSAEGYLNGSANFDTKGITESDTLYVDIYLKKLETGKAYRLKNIYYDFDKWDLRQESKLTLDTLYNLLMENPTIIIELSSHTDTRGSDSYNTNLSQKRAESCVNYLISKGIPKNRLTAKGYGEARLLDDCTKYNECPPDNVSDCPCHQFNRRTEFKVVGELDAKLIYEDERYDEEAVKEDQDKKKSKK